MEPDTDLHTYWTCPCNDNIDDEAVTNSNKYKDKAIRESISLPCLWLRGILPAHFTYVDTTDIPLTRVFHYTGISPTKGVWPSGRHWGGARGGGRRYTRYPSPRRRGCSVASVNSDASPGFGLFYRLPGPIQTVPREELSVIVTRVEFAVEGAILTYVGDNKPVIDVFHKGPDACKSASDADLCIILLSLIRCKRTPLSLKWMPSHLDDTECKKVKPDWVTELDILGNGVVDSLADDAANWVSWIAASGQYRVHCGGWWEKTAWWPQWGWRRRIYCMQVP